MGRTLTCSFCGKSEHEVEKLVAGPSVFICDGCVAIAARVMEDADGATPRPALWRRLVAWARGLIASQRLQRAAA